MEEEVLLFSFIITMKIGSEIEIRGSIIFPVVTNIYIIPTLESQKQVQVPSHTL